MKYEIYQIKEDKEREFAFRRYESIIKRYGKVSSENYEKVYEGEKDDVDLESLFEEFNVNRPEDFKGHSLSVSDVVVMDGVAYYCDSFGWQKLSSF